MDHEGFKIRGRINPKDWRLPYLEWDTGFFTISKLDKSWIQN